jgi:hypothetical protein
LGKIKNCNSLKNGHILSIENKIVNDLMSSFLNRHWIHKGSRSI